MRFDEAALILKNMHQHMLRIKEAGQSALLLGLYFSNEIENVNMKALCREANISESYAIEMYRGRKIAPYVKLEPAFKQKFLTWR